MTISHANHHIKCYASCHYSFLAACARFDTGICICKCVSIHITFFIWDYEEYLNVVLWWRHQLGTFSALLTLWAGNSPVTGGFPSQRPVTGSFDDFFDLGLNKSLSKQSWSWWFETPSRLLWRHCNDMRIVITNVRDLRWPCGGHDLCRHGSVFVDWNSHIFIDPEILISV